MSKIAEKHWIEDDKIIIKKTHDGSAVLNDVKYAREVAPNDFGSDYKHVGNVDMDMLNNWLKDAGVAWTDTPAVREVIKKKLMSSEFAGLRNWQGSW
jgi:hypothetical protein